MSVTRASEDLKFAVIKSKTVQSGQTVTKGKAVKFGAGGEGYVQDCAAGNSAIGIALETGAAGAQVQIALLCSAGLLKVLVGTGGATCGKEAVVVADGLTDAATLGGGTTLVNTVGVFYESGVVGDTVALMPVRAPAVKV